MIKRWYFFSCTVTMPYPYSPRIVTDIWWHRSLFSNPKQVKANIERHFVEEYKGAFLKTELKNNDFSYEKYQEKANKISSLLTDLKRV